MAALAAMTLSSTAEDFIDGAYLADVLVGRAGPAPSAPA